MFIAPIVIGLSKATLATASSQLGGKRLKRGRPEPPEVVEPDVDLA